MHIHINLITIPKPHFSPIFFYLAWLNIVNHNYKHSHNFFFVFYWLNLMFTSFYFSSIVRFFFLLFICWYCIFIHKLIFFFLFILIKSERVINVYIKKVNDCNIKLLFNSARTQLLQRRRPQEQKFIKHYDIAGEKEQQQRRRVLNNIIWLKVEKKEENLINIFWT